MLCRGKLPDWYAKGDTKKKYFTNFMSELIATALLMFLTCMGCIPQVDDPPAIHHMPALSAGLVVLLVIQIFGHISMSHINPSVTICAVILKILSPAMGLIYIVAQLIGATLGLAVLKLLMPEIWMVPGFCTTKPHAKTTVMQALAIETIITGVLILVCCAIWDKRNAHNQDSICIRFGFIVGVIAMVAGPFTGASMNTARSFAPAVLGGDYTYHWIYWVGPMFGAVIGTFLYLLLFAYEEDGGIEVDEVNHNYDH